MKTKAIFMLLTTLVCLIFSDVMYGQIYGLHTNNGSSNISIGVSSANARLHINTPPVPLPVIRMEQNQPIGILKLELIIN